jgi:hypothetical protein
MKYCLNTRKTLPLPVEIITLKWDQIQIFTSSMADASKEANFMGKTDSKALV